MPDLEVIDLHVRARSRGSHLVRYTDERDAGNMLILRDARSDKHTLVFGVGNKNMTVAPLGAGNDLLENKRKRHRSNIPCHKTPSPVKERYQV